MPLKSTMVAAADSMRSGGRQCEAVLVSGVMPQEAGRGVMPRGGDGADMLRRQGDGVMPSGGDDVGDELTSR
jgi:hypothetical protein